MKKIAAPYLSKEQLSHNVNFITNQDTKLSIKIQQALHAIPPGIDHDLWITIGMAFKDGGGSFQEFNDWSSAAENYSENDCRIAWNSFKAGGITVATLFHLAKKFGYQPQAKSNHQNTFKAYRTALTGQEKIDSKREHDAKLARKKAETTLNQCSIAKVDHPYLMKKQIAPRLLPWVDITNRLIIPVMDLKGELHSLQLISPDGTKRFMPGGMIRSHFYQLWTGCNGDIVICEGYATGVTLYTHYVPEYSVYVAFNAGNLIHVARTLRDAYPEKKIIIAGDCDSSLVGQTKALEAALSVNGSYTIPRFQDHESGSDFNDRWCLDNKDAT